VNGRFTLQNVPTGNNIPLVIQVGKWRRQVTIPKVTGCVDNPLTDVNLTRLPRSKSEGNIPKIAVTTGSSDAFECLLRKIGVADAEYTRDTGNGRINLYAGGDPAVAPGGNGPGAIQFNAALGGGKFPWATTLWGSTSKMMGYDLLIFSCEGGQFGDVKSPYSEREGLRRAGGRIFADHLHLLLPQGPAPWPSTAAYIDPAARRPAPSTATINTGFPGRGAGRLAVARGGRPRAARCRSTNRRTARRRSWARRRTGSRSTRTRTTRCAAASGDPVHDVQHTGSRLAAERRWAAGLHRDPPTAPRRGRQDGHLDPGMPFPDAAAERRSAQEKALEFLFFDLSRAFSRTPEAGGARQSPPPGA
jgi:hypothetical protein